MILEWLPGAGAKPWSDRTGYVIHDQTWIGDLVVVLGRQTFDGRECDWFVGVYDHEGNRWPGSGGRTMTTADRAREVFDAFVRGRRAA